MSYNFDPDTGGETTVYRHPQWKVQAEKRIQCKYCIQVLTSEQRYARHIVTKHPEKVEDYLKTGGRY